MNTFATERYTLGAMTAAERDAFEEHFVDCSICAADVREAAQDSIEILEPKPEPQPQPLPWQWRHRYLLPIAAALIIAVAGPSLWEQLSSRQSGPDRVKPTLSFVSDARGSAEQRVILADAEATFVVGIPEVEGAEAYRVEVREGSRLVQGWDVRPDEIQETVSLSLSPLPPGDYELVIESVDRRGGKRLEITRESFNAKSEGRPTN